MPRSILTMMVSAKSIFKPMGIAFFKMVVFMTIIGDSPIGHTKGNTRKLFHI
jgi:hypothetical protein